MFEEIHKNTQNSYSQFITHLKLLWKKLLKRHIKIFKEKNLLDLKNQKSFLGEKKKSKKLNLKLIG